MYHLDVVEKDYFGLRFMDSAQVPVRVKKFLESECKICFNMGLPDLIITFLFITNNLFCIKHCIKYIKLILHQIWLK